ncbi:MAG TPA: bifunctional riboflavin kinase/FAD synthetase [Syntrophomonadaceae bacterium]|nr:bifunctional riboflavin kinase/FAD synthetase [Syntrophomonadaceae bacterium]HPR93058.1 bifunctional riboflavin kinase/FAD synthetase [Syntrophomonadaceae bacterium]
MDLIFGVDSYIKSDQALYLALGNFDGIHMGHKELINQLVKKAANNKGLSAAFIFEPHPIKVIRPEKAPKMLVTPERKAKLLDELGLDILIYQDFTREISCWSPEHFAREILVDKLAVKEVLVGFNYSFGHKGQGTPELLITLGKQLGFGVNVIAPVEVKGHLVSSSLIRQLLTSGDIPNAAAMLGNEPMLQAQIIRGENRGASLGFPTANLKVNEDLIIPGPGVYAGKIIINKKTFKCVVNIGTKPTFHDEYPITVEVHIIDFSGDIYGEEVELFFASKLRDEKKFAGIEQLVEQIGKDREQAIKITS